MSVSTASLVRDVDQAFPAQQSLMDGVRPERRAQQPLERLRQPMRRDRAEMLTVIDYQGTMDSPAEAARLFQYRIEHRGEVAG